VLHLPQLLLPAVAGGVQVATPVGAHVGICAAVQANQLVAIEDPVGLLQGLQSSVAAWTPVACELLLLLLLLQVLLLLCLLLLLLAVLLVLLLVECHHVGSQPILCRSSGGHTTAVVVVVVMVQVAVAH
jgi:hypothetical protein